MGGAEGGGGRKGGRGARQARHFRPIGPATLCPLSPPLWSRQTRHSEPVGPTFLGLSGPSPLGPFGHLGPSSPSSIKPVGWSRALKKIKFSARPGPLTGQRAYRPGQPGLARWRPLTGGYGDHLRYDQDQVSCVPARG